MQAGVFLQVQKGYPVSVLCPWKRRGGGGEGQDASPMATQSHPRGET